MFFYGRASIGNEKSLSLEDMVCGKIEKQYVEAKLKSWVWLTIYGMKNESTEKNIEKIRHLKEVANKSGYSEMLSRPGREMNTA